MNTLEILKGMRELLSDPSKWTQRSIARDQYGKDVIYANDPEACRWCLYGAMSKVFPVPSDAVRTPPEYSDIFEALEFKGPAHMIMWNDSLHRTHQHIVKRLDKAIAKLA